MIECGVQLLNTVENMNNQATYILKILVIALCLEINLWNPPTDKLIRKQSKILGVVHFSIQDYLNILMILRFATYSDCGDFAELLCYYYITLIQIIATYIHTHARTHRHTHTHPHTQ